MIYDFDLNKKLSDQLQHWVTLLKLARRSPSCFRPNATKLGNDAQNYSLIETVLFLDFFSVSFVLRNDGA